MGAEFGQQWIFQFTKLFQISCVHEDLFTMSVGVPVGDVDHLVSFDADKEIFNQLLLLTDGENRAHIKSRLQPTICQIILRPLS